MSKYNYTANQAEALINIIGGMENLERILRQDSCLEVNPVYEKLRETEKRYQKELKDCGAIILGSRKSGVRDIILPVDSSGSEESAFLKLERATVKRGLSFFAKNIVDFPFNTSNGEKRKIYISLRNTLEFEKEHRGRVEDKWLLFWNEKWEHQQYITGRDTLCLMTQYLNLFVKDWFDIAQEVSITDCCGDYIPILPVSFGVCSGPNKSLVIKPENSQLIECLSGDVHKQHCPWLTV
ncbi:MAG: hypothetical protein WC878_06725 [Candidatus Paceibacterota bacterium]|jgi:hypothetical protein